VRLNFCRRSRAEDRIEEWIVRQHQQRVLAGETAPTGPCPSDSFLSNLARKSKRIVLSDPRVDHAATCPRCMRRLLDIRQAIRSHRRRVVAAFSAVSCLTFVVLFTLALRYRTRQHLASPALIAQTVDLWDAGTDRGEQVSNLESVSLPAARIRATVILPAFSRPGQYVIAVARDRNGEGIVAEGQSLAESVDNQQRVRVDLDLRGVTAGRYFLSSTHEQDHASYYYPLEIK
jgi:hypothetical protein